MFYRRLAVRFGIGGPHAFTCALKLKVSSASFVRLTPSVITTLPSQLNRVQATVANNAMENKDRPLASRGLGLEYLALRLRNGVPNTETREECNIARSALDLREHNNSYILVLVDAHSHPVSPYNR